jgi:hypothetical protein
MKIPYLNRPVFPMLLTGLMALLAGCATSGYRAGEHTASSLQASAQGIERANVPVDTAVAELNDLVNSPEADLRPQFNKFSAAVAKLNGLPASIRKADEDMQARGKIHFENWDKELAAMQNDAIRANGQARKLAVLSQLDGVRNECSKVLTEFAPLQSDLQDAHRFLNSDLTAGGLTAMKDATARINQLATPMHESVGKLVTDMRALGVAMSPQNAAAK